MSGRQLVLLLVFLMVIVSAFADGFYSFTGLVIPGWAHLIQTGGFLWVLTGWLTLDARKRRVPLIFDQRYVVPMAVFVYLFYHLVRRHGWWSLGYLVVLYAIYLLVFFMSFVGFAIFPALW